MFPRPLAAGLSAFAALIALALPAAAAGTDHAALRDRSLAVLEAQFGAFRDTAAALADAAASHCAGPTGREDYLSALRRAWLAWAPLDAYQFGPIVQNGAVLTVSFWPDKKDYVGRGLQTLLAEPPEALRDPATIARHSAAVQGLPAIERLLFDDLPACPAIVGISAHLETTAQTLHADWFAAGGWADLARTAGPDNPVYLSAGEFTKVLFTAIDFELTRIADVRLGRPLGTFDTPRPARAEARLSGLGLDIIDAQLAGIAALVETGFAEAVAAADRAEVLHAIERNRARIGRIGAPLDAAVSDPARRFRVEALQSGIRALQRLIAARVGPGLGVETGFSAADGD